jgi:6-phosphofructokinase 1
MDNDVRNTEYCIGFSTAITRASDAIQRQRTTVASHERIGIFRVFGRDAGFTALYTAYVTSIRFRARRRSGFATLASVL